MAVNRKAILERAGNKSEISGRTGELHIDHIVPKGRGGSDDPSNLRVLEISEHNSRHIWDHGYSPAERYHWKPFQLSWFWIFWKMLKADWGKKVEWFGENQPE